jgi:hypothetical protein
MDLLIRTIMFSGVRVCAANKDLIGIRYYHDFITHLSRKAASIDVEEVIPDYIKRKQG